MKKILALLLCMIMVLSFSVNVIAADFSDTVTHKNKVAIDNVSAVGIVEGYGNNLFGPDDVLTRAQICTMLVRAMYKDDMHYDNTSRFTDVPLSHWARIYIDTAYKNNLMVGNGDGTFDPEDGVTYTEVARTILNSLGYGQLSWPDGVNLVALELGLYKDVDAVDYNATCTRAHAVQMIYNAFDAELVKDYAGIPMRTGKTFLVDLIGYNSITVSEGGIQYLAYQSIKDGTITKTSQVLTTECTIYPVTSGSQYRLVDNSRAEKYDIDWTKVTLFVNNSLVETNMKNWFKDADIATGVFDIVGNLVSIRVINSGISYVAATGLNMEFIPLEILNDVYADDNFNIETSTITYYDENGSYDISNSFICGFVTNMTRGIIWIDNMPYTFKNVFNYIDCMNKFVVLYYDVHGQLIDVMPVDIPYFYDMWNMTVHTWECEEYRNKVTDANWANGTEAVKIHPLANFYVEKNNTNLLIFENCEHCHTKDVYDYKVNFVLVENIVEEPVVSYITKDSWKYYHSTIDCEYIVKPEDKVDTVIYDAAIHTAHQSCPKCVTN